MGFPDIIRECIFTGEKTRAIVNGTAAVEYFVVVNGKQHVIKYTHLDEHDPFFVTNKDIFYGLLYNDDWFEDEEVFISIDELQNLLKSKSFPTTPEDKLERLFLNLFKEQKEDGQLIDIDDEHNNVLWKILYFKSIQEMNYYIDVLRYKELIEAQINGKGWLENYRITFGGLNYQLKLITEGDKSNKCFVAMKFGQETMGIRTAIKDAIDKTGFKPILMDEINIDSDTSINDEIIANLKRCKFCIADFTFHSMGVYFESGHALGQGKKVIYTCRKDQFEKVHFDIKPLQHIIYESPEELTKALINKIYAWIK